MSTKLAVLILLASLAAEKVSDAVFTPHMVMTGVPR